MDVICILQHMLCPQFSQSLHSRCGKILGEDSILCDSEDFVAGETVIINDSGFGLRERTRTRLGGFCLLLKVLESDTGESRDM